jgi:transcription elongation GreA/GreB family factor
MDDQPKAYWILSYGGGYALDIDSEIITTISSKTPLAGQLIAKCRGDVFEFKVSDHWREFTIVDFE